MVLDTRTLIYTAAAAGTQNHTNKKYKSRGMGESRKDDAWHAADDDNGEGKLHPSRNALQQTVGGMNRQGIP